MTAEGFQMIAAALALYAAEPAQASWQSSREASTADSGKVTVEQVHAPARRAPSAASTERVEALQVTRTGSRMVATENVSSRLDGRSVAATRIDGKDRCDPAHLGAAPTATAACTSPIESRASEYRRKPEALSPEQRLLIQQDPSILQAVTGGGTERPPGAIDDAAAAMTVLGQPPAPDGGIPPRGGETPRP